MIRFFAVLVTAGLIGVLSGCATTSKTDDNPDKSVAKLLKEERARQWAQVKKLSSEYRAEKWKNKISDDFKRHNWIEWPFAGTFWGLSFIFSGHQSKDIDKLHSQIDKYFFNAAWDDPYLID